MEVREPIGAAGTVAGTEEELPTRLRLVDETADVAQAYLRWIDANTCDGLPYARLRLLGLLHCRGSAMMRALGDQLGLTPRNMTALVDALEAEGLVVRRAHPTDRRAVLIELTDAGRTAGDEALTTRVETMATLFDDLSAVDQEQLSASLSQLRAALRRRGLRA